jgi:hypothetical protein
MDTKSGRRWARGKGEPVNVVDALLARIPADSLESLAVRARLSRPTGDAVKALTTYDGDAIPSANGLCVCIVDGSLALEKLKLEIEDQIRRSEGAAPARYLHALTTILAMERRMLEMISYSTILDELVSKSLATDDDPAGVKPDIAAKRAQERADRHRVADRDRKRVKAAERRAAEADARSDEEP